MIRFTPFMVVGRVKAYQADDRKPRVW